MSFSGQSTEIPDSSKIPCPESVRLICPEFIHVGQIPDMTKIFEQQKSDIFRT